MRTMHVGIVATLAFFIVVDETEAQQYSGWLGGGHLRERTYFGGSRACRHDLSYTRAGHAVQLLGFGPETCADLCRVWGD